MQEGCSDPWIGIGARRCRILRIGYRVGCAWIRSPLTRRIMSSVLIIARSRASPPCSVTVLGLHRSSECSDASPGGRAPSVRPHKRGCRLLRLSPSAVSGKAESESSPAAARDLCDGSVSSGSVSAPWSKKTGSGHPRNAALTARTHACLWGRRYSHWGGGSYLGFTGRVLWNAWSALGLTLGVPALCLRASGQDQCCAICCCEYVKDEITTELPCHHIFHKICVTLWLRKVSLLFCAPVCVPFSKV